MSEDGNASGPGGPPKKRRRRRRGRKPAGEGGGGSGDSAAKQADGASGGRGRRSGKPGEGGGPPGDKPRKSRRRRRGGRGRREGGEAREGGDSRESRAPRGRGRRGGRGRDRDRDADRERREPSADDSTKPDAPPPSPPPEGDDIDLGWDDAPAAKAQSPEPSDDEPARPIELAADLPARPPGDDPDPTSYLADDDDGSEFVTGVRNIVGVKYATAGKIYQFDAGDLVFERGDEVVVETDRGTRLATVAIPSVRKPHTHRALKRALRHPTDNDRRTLERNAERAADALSMARSRARELRMPIKVFRASYGLSGNKLQIYFTADERIDFRNLVRDLSAKLHCRIEMRQTGVRDEAKMIGGIGSCGRELCCTTWMPDFVPVSIKMAKDQGLVLNPTKVSGQCGRLKCCLVYEQSVYAEMRKGLPRLGKRVVTGDGEGRVVEVDVLRQRIRVSLGGGEFKVYAAEEVEPLFPSQQPRAPKKPKKKPQAEPNNE